MVRATFTWLLLAVMATGCNALRTSVEECERDEDCEAPRTCDAELSICRVAESAVACQSTEADGGCGLFSDCISGVCVAADPVIALINNPLIGPTRDEARVQHGAMQFALSEIGAEFERYGRTPRLLQIPAGLDETSRTAAFARAVDENAAVVLTLEDEVTRGAQRFFSGRRTLVLAVHSNYPSFATAEAPSLRYAYGLVPEPSADFAMWSRFLSDRSTCDRVTAVYVAGTPDDGVLRHMEQQIPRHGLTWVSPVAVTPGANLEEVVRKFEQLQVDCAFALPIVDEEPTDTFATFFERWHRSKGDASEVRWLFHNAARFESLRRAVNDASAEYLQDAFVVRYEVGGERSARILERFRQFYAAEYITECPEDPCYGPVADQHLDALAPYVALSYDQMILATMTLLRALREPRGSRTLVRRAFQSINDGSTQVVECSSDSAPVCFEGIARGAAPRYRGASGELLFQEDGRPETLDEVMVFSRWEGVELIEVDRFTHEDMSRAIRTSSQ